MNNPQILKILVNYFNDKIINKLTDTLKTYIESKIPLMIVPDYTNQETVNRLTSMSSTFTVQKHGFVNLSREIGVTAGNGAILINGKSVIYGYSSASRNSGVFPVKKGDVISITGANTSAFSSTGTSCYFIPPLYIYNTNQ